MCWLCLSSRSSETFFFIQQKTAYEMRISDRSSDVCSSDLGQAHGVGKGAIAVGEHRDGRAGIGILAPRAHHEGVVDRGADDLVDALRLDIFGLEIGRAPCRERVCQYV